MFRENALLIRMNENQQKQGYASRKISPRHQSRCRVLISSLRREIRNTLTSIKFKSSYSSKGN